MAPARRRSANAGPPPSIAPFAIAGGIVAAGAAGWFGFPPLPLVWMGFLVAAWTEQPAEMTGKKDSYGYPTAAHPGEEAAMRSWRFWKDLRFRLLFPNTDWLPGWPPLASWLVAAWAAALSLLLPIASNPRWVSAMHGAARATEATRGLDAAAAFLVIAQVSASRRRAAGEDCPGTRVGSLPAAWASSPVQMAAATLAGAFGGLVVGIVARHLAARYHFALHHSLYLAAALGAGGALLGMIVPWRTAALERWRALVEARAAWKPRWTALKQDPAPTLVEHADVGPATVDTFNAPSTGAMTYWPMAPKIAPTMGAGVRPAVLEVPDVGPDGPVPGSRHPLQFSVVAWPATALPDLTDPSTTPEVARLFAHSAMAWALEARGYGRPVPLAVEAASAPGSPKVVWRSAWAWPGGPSLTEVRPLVADLVKAFGCPVLVDHRTDTVYFGAIGDPEVTWPEDGDLSATLAELGVEDAWTARWEATLKTGAQPPTIQHSTYEVKALAGGAEVRRQAFVVRLGIDPGSFRGLEAKLATVLDAAPYVAVCGWPGKGDRPGERHPQAFAVYWSSSPVPTSPASLAPSAGASWVLAGRVNSAFDSARLARPEMVSARCLTRPGSRGHLWEVALRLYGGVTLADVRARAERLRQSLGVPWLRVGDSPDGATIFAGVDPDNAALARPGDASRLVALDWEQAWADSGVVGAAGDLPDLVEVGHLEANPAVSQLDFSLPPGIDRLRVKMALGKLGAATKNAFVELRESPRGAGVVRLLVSRESPLPAMASFDFAAADSIPDGMPFATGVDGRAVAFRPGESPHVLVAGVTGGGKSVLVCSLIYGAAIQGAEIYVLDPVKGGADFSFAREYSRAFVASPREAAAALRAVYAEIVRRKNFNTAHGVGSGSELPPELSYPRMLVVIDEFTSLLGASPVPKSNGDPELDAERDLLEEENQARAEVGVFTGKIAREARSALVTLVLATQKMSAKMLEAIPGGANDLKDLSLDTRLPVPVSAKFPAGWALNRELDIGDVLFACDGSSVPVVGLSETFTDSDLYSVTFDDGQVVEAGGRHLWTASSRLDRDRASKRRSDPSSQSVDGRLQGLRALAQAIPVGTLASVCDLAEMTGYSTDRVYELVRAFRLEPYAANDYGEIVPGGDRSRAAPLWAVEHAIPLLWNRYPAVLRALAPFLDEWMTAKDLAERIGYEHQPVRLASLLRRGGCPVRDGAPTNYLFDVCEFTSMLVEHLRSRRALPCQQVISTAEMAASLGSMRWAVRQADPIHGRETDLPVPPYTLGVWLGDGSTGSGIVTASERVVDAQGLSDQEHVLAQLTADGFQPHVLECKSNLVGTRGLKEALRSAGVLDRKHIPPLYLRASFEQRLALLQGLMDTDGDCTLSGGCVITQVREQLAFGIAELVRTLGVRSQVSTRMGRYRLRDGTYKDTRTVYAVSFSMPHPAFRLARKLAKQRRTERVERWRSIRSIEPIPSKPSRCIAIDHPSHLFLVEGFLPTHNTNLARILLGKASSGDRMSALRAFDDAPTLDGEIPKGRGLWEPLTSTAQIIQCWYAPQSALAEALAARRPPLRPDERLDLSPFLRGRSETPASTGVAPDVVDVGEIELSLDDLDYVEGPGGDKRQGDAPPAADAKPEVTTDSAPPGAGEVGEPNLDALILLDVDGTLSPLDRPRTWGDWEVAAGGGYAGSALVSPSLCSALSGMGATLAWLTTWEDEAPPALGHLFPGREMEVLHPPSHVAGWWKLTALLAHLTRHPEVRRVVWFDDDLAAHLSLDEERTNAEVATEELDRLGVTHMLIAPPANVGIAPDDTEAARRFLAGESPAASAEASGDGTGASDARASTPEPSASPDDDPFGDVPLRPAPISSRLDPWAEPLEWGSPAERDGESDDDWERPPDAARQAAAAATDDDPFA